jgi:hypothetical protein
MTYSADDWRVAITTLLKKTSRKEIKWELSDIFRSDVWSIVDRSFASSIGEKTYTVSSTRRKQYIDEEEYVWEHGFDFSIYIKEYQEYIRIASAPDSLNVIETLFNAVDANFAYDQGALKDLLE